MPEDRAIANPERAINGAVKTNPINAITTSAQRGRPFRIPDPPAMFSSRMASERMAFAESFDSANNMCDFVFTHPRKDWQAHQPFPLRGGHRKIFRAPAKRFLIVRMQMQRSPMH